MKTPQVAAPWSKHGADEDTAVKIMQLALEYLMHPDVRTIPFALPVDNVVRMIENYIADNAT